jgi:hypothetical protein
MKLMLTLTGRIGLFAAALVASVAAQAATLMAPEGAALVNGGEGFKAAKAATVLKSGDSIMVQPGVSAQLIYGDGCSVAVTSGSVVVVAAKSPCAARANMAKPYYSGVNDALDPREAPPSAAVPALAGISPVVAVVGGLAIVGGAAAIIGSKKNSRKAASP